MGTSFLKNISAWLSLGILLMESLSAQTPSDAILMPGRSACVLAGYEIGRFDQYWEGKRLRENQTIATVSRSTFLPMIAVGITGKWDVYAALPYVKTASSEPNGGFFAGASGLQDLMVATKYEFLKKQLGNGELTALASLSFSTPASRYLSDYMPYSLGLGAPELGWRAIGQYKWSNGPYARLTAAYLWRGYTEAERDYYYNNGSRYTAWMDVPSAWNVEAVFGAWLLNNALRLELQYSKLAATSGDDIRPYNAPQPTNRMDMDRMGALAQYYVPFIKGLGLLAYHQRIFNGANAPRMNSSGFGLTWQFNYLNPTPKNHEN